MNPSTTRELSSELQALQRLVVSWFEWFGELTLFTLRMARAVVTPPFEWRELLRQMDSVGTRTLPVVALAGAATGIVLTLQTRDSLSRFGARSMLPAIAVYSLIRETGPLITALVGCGRIAAGIGAELGSMRVTEQIDAMEASAVDPYKYLAATRVIACITMLPLLTLVVDFCGILLSWISNALSDNMSLQSYIEHGFKDAQFGDFLPPTFKTAVFGLIMGVVSTFQGMRTTGGTEGVGRSATSSVVISSLMIVVVDVVLVRLITLFFE